MKLVFAGTPDFARCALEALVAAGHDAVLVLAQPDRPSGRGLKVEPGPVKSFALSRGLRVLQPRGLRIGGKYDDDARAAHALLRETPHDAMIVAAYGLILPQGVLDIAPRGCMNIHASLLPRWRGAAPVQRAIEAGDAQTGVTIMQMDAGLDTGPILRMRAIPIERADTGGSLTTKLAALGGELMVEALASLEEGTLAARPQHPPGDEGAVRYATKIAKSESSLAFDGPSRAIVDRIRAFDPWPGCTATLVHDDDRPATTLKVWRAQTIEAGDAALLFPGAYERAAPGELLTTEAATPRVDRPAAIVVRTADAAIALLELQKPGGRRLPATAFFSEIDSARRPRLQAPASA